MTRLLFAVALLVVLLALASSIAWARYVGTEQAQYSPEMKDWVKSLRAPGTAVWCCDVADGDFTQQDVSVSADGKEHWRASIGGVWVDVPEEAVIKEPNQLGRPIVWYSQGKSGAFYIRCFLPGALG